MDKPLQEIVNELKKRNIRPSYQRLKILEYLMKERYHPTAEGIYFDLHKKIPTLSKSTIYNTLNLFIEKKLLKEVSIENNETRYDIILTNHGHFKCDKCGEIIDFKVNIDDFVAEDLKDYKIREKDVNFKGICPKCLKVK
jgi:Fur family peroxide stress response transcriptional regulator